MGEAKFIEIVPDLVVEILSPSSRLKDRIQKLDLYRRYEVRHYWIVDPDEGIIEAYKLQNKNYTLMANTDGHFTHSDFPDLSFHIQKVCAKPQ